MDRSKQRTSVMKTGKTFPVCLRLVLEEQRVVLDFVVVLLMGHAKWNQWCSVPDPIVPGWFQNLSSPVRNLVYTESSQVCCRWALCNLQMWAMHETIFLDWIIPLQVMWTQRSKEHISLSAWKRNPCVCHHICKTSVELRFLFLNCSVWTLPLLIV